MFILFFVGVTAMLQAIAYDAVEVGDYTGSGESNFVTYSRPDYGYLAQAETTTVENLANGQTFKFISNAIDTATADFNYDGRDDYIYLQGPSNSADRESPRGYQIQMRYDETSGASLYSPVHGVGMNRILAGDLDHDGYVEIVSAQLDGPNIKLLSVKGLKLDNEPFIPGGSFVGFTFNWPAYAQWTLSDDIKDIILFPSLSDNKEDASRYIMLYTAHSYQIYEVQFSLEKTYADMDEDLYSYHKNSTDYKLISSETVTLVTDKVLPVQATKSQFIDDYNLAFISSSWILFKKFTKDEGIIAEESVDVTYPSFEQQGGVLEEIYVPKFFENRIAAWFSDSTGDGGYLCFYRLENNNGILNLVRKDEVRYESKPSICKYNPEFYHSDSSQASANGSWGIVVDENFTTYEYSSTP